MKIWLTFVCSPDKHKKLFLSIFVFALIAGCDSGDDQHINFYGLAQNGQWFNDAGDALTFGSTTSDSKGFARFVQTQLEDGLRYDEVLETHPRWVDNGTVEGRFRMTMPEGVGFRAVVGFIEGATGTDGANFQMIWRKDPPAGQPPIDAVQGQVFKTYDHSLASFTADLRPIAGQTGELILKVKAGASSGQDWAVWQSAVLAPFAEIDDVDKDGVSDIKEWQLLQYYSPYYKFSTESINFQTVQEGYRPTDAIWYLRHSDLLFGGDQNSPIVIAQDRIYQDAGLVTNAQWWKTLEYSDILSTTYKTSYRMNIFDDYRSGFYNGDGHDWPEITSKGNIGTYGHVTPTADPNIFKMEYWQFFGYNKANAYNVDAFDHESDWCYIAVTANITANKIISVSYAHHGDQETRIFGQQRFAPPFYTEPPFWYFGDDNADLILMYQVPGEQNFHHPVVFVVLGGP